SPEPKSTTNPFTDVKPTDFFYKSVLWAVENNITSGITETEFGPTNPCSRAQVVTFLYKAYT
ncbi:MAG: S-layer homology domain-containing protein, partial [Oscillospiraceae bacterium]|nr:S-layer homology domain-containing protein [Oscillospiraceae bacterium]